MDAIWPLSGASVSGSWIARAGRAAIRSVFALSSPYVKGRSADRFKRLESAVRGPSRSAQDTARRCLAVALFSSQKTGLFTIDSYRLLGYVEEFGFVSSFLYLRRASLSGFVFALSIPCAVPGVTPFRWRVKSLGLRVVGD